MTTPAKNAWAETLSAFDCENRAEIVTRLHGYTQVPRYIPQNSGFCCPYSVGADQLSKQIAAKLHLSEITVKVCRAQLMKKMGASSLADLVRMSERLGPAPPKD